MPVPGWFDGALRDGLSAWTDDPRHDDVVFVFRADKKTGWPANARVLSEVPRSHFTMGVTRVNALVYLSDKCATIPVATNLNPPKGPAMPAVELSPRQITALLTVKNSGPCTAAVVAEAIEPGSDSRGAAQTLRRLISDTGYVEKNDKGCYKITAKGRSAANRHAKASESDPVIPTGSVVD